MRSDGKPDRQYAQGVYIWQEYDGGDGWKWIAARRMRWHERVWWWVKRWTRRGR